MYCCLSKITWQFERCLVNVLCSSPQYVGEDKLNFFASLSYDLIYSVCCNCIDIVCYYLDHSRGNFCSLIDCVSASIGEIVSNKKVSTLPVTFSVCTFLIWSSLFYFLLSSQIWMSNVLVWWHQIPEVDFFQFQ